MCKHILFTNFDAINDIDLIENFIHATNENDGYGAIIRTKENELFTYKSLNQGAFYLNVMKSIKEMPISELVLHHRTSTNGRGLDYSHPFEHKGNLLTHNGVIDVPLEYTTKTSNDSEKLLHHLIETDYTTNTIQGYFSCFILNAESTTVLVDNIAPIYTDNRVYCSHKLTDSMIKIESIRVTKLVNGDETSQAIELMQSSYGQDKAYLSLGKGGKSSAWSSDDSWYSQEFDWSDYGDKSVIQNDNVTLMLDYMTNAEESFLYTIGDKHELRIELEALSRILDIQLTKKELKTLVKYFSVESRSMHG